MDNNADTGSSKARSHLLLLREEYSSLQKRFQDLSRKHDLSQANGTANDGEESFAASLVTAVSKMHLSNNNSDASVLLADSTTPLPAHKWILEARSPIWRKQAEESSPLSLDWTSLPGTVGRTLLRWVYVDALEDESNGLDESGLLALLRAAGQWELSGLRRQCEERLVGAVGKHNCIAFMAVAQEIGASTLRKHCALVIDSNWSDFSRFDFDPLSAVQLHSLLRERSSFPLHAAVSLHREDVVLLVLIEQGQELSSCVNVVDENGSLPLDLALISKQTDLAETLLQNKADVDQTNAKGVPMLHVTIERNDEFSSTFLLEHGCQINLLSPDESESALHLAARLPAMTATARLLLDKGANVNAQNRDRKSPLHNAVESKNLSCADLLLERNASTDLASSAGETPLWMALKAFNEQEDSNMGIKLLKSGASSNAVYSPNGDTLLHGCALESLESAALFLLHNASDCDVGLLNSNGESALHLAASKGLASMCRELLLRGSNANAQTTVATAQFGDAADGLFRQTPLHLAVVGRHAPVVTELLLMRSEWGGDNERMNLDLKDSQDQTALSLALSAGMVDVANELLQAGSSVNVTNSQGFTMLHTAIIDADTKGSVFLLENGADFDLKTSVGQSPVELAIKHNLPNVLEVLCRKGADLSSSNGAPSSAAPPLWTALQQDGGEPWPLASLLVRHGVDTDAWGEGPEGCIQSLLHKAIDENASDLAIFLIRSGCDLNATRRVGSDGRGAEEGNDLATPLHLCAQWGLEMVVQTLIEQGADVNAKDIEGKSALHMAIENGHQNIISLLLSFPGIDLESRDNSGQSPLATAMLFKNNKAAQRILDMEPAAAECYDNRGKNFLHSAILKNSLESVLFLLSIQVNVNSKTQDSNLLTPLLLAVLEGNEMIVRNLLLAGASVSSRNIDGGTALHVAAEHDLAPIGSILLSNQIDFSAVDGRGNNALHTAVQHGHLSVVRSLLTESKIDAEAFNNKGRNPLHVLAIFGKENAAAIYDLFIECMPQYPFDRVDSEGNSPLLLAYGKGHGALCRSLVRSGACLATMNAEGVSIFNCPVATRQLLMRMLDALSAEPTWGSGDSCQECLAKFGITTRKHHCRHCGRLLCSKCSDDDMPILKYNLSKPVRVCKICAEILMIGPGTA